MGWCSCRVCVVHPMIFNCFRIHVLLQPLAQQPTRLEAIPSIPTDTHPIPIEIPSGYPPDTHALCIALCVIFEVHNDRANVAYCHDREQCRPGDFKPPLFIV